MTRKNDIQTHFNNLIIRPTDKPAGTGIYRVDDLEGEYQVLATYQYKWTDGSTTFCFLFTSTVAGSPILERAAYLFEAVSVD